MWPRPRPFLAQFFIFCLVFLTPRNMHFDVSFVKVGPTVWPLAALKNKQKILKNKKAQTINISPLRGDHAPEPIDMPFSVLTPVTDVIIPAKCYVDPLKGFWEGNPQKCHFLYFLERPLQQFCTTVQTVIWNVDSLCQKGNSSFSDVSWSDLCVCAQFYFRFFINLLQVSLNIGLRAKCLHLIWNLAVAEFISNDKILTGSRINVLTAHMQTSSSQVSKNGIKRPKWPCFYKKTGVLNSNTTSDFKPEVEI